MSIHTIPQKHAAAARLFYLLEAHTLADVLGGQSDDPERDRQGRTTVTAVGAAGQRAKDDARSRRAAYERSALRAEFHTLSSNCEPS